MLLLPLFPLFDSIPLPGSRVDFVTVCAVPAMFRIVFSKLKSLYFVGRHFLPFSFAPASTLAGTVDLSASGMSHSYLCPCPPLTRFLLRSKAALLDALKAAGASSPSLCSASVYKCPLRRCTVDCAWVESRSSCGQRNCMFMLSPTFRLGIYSKRLP